MCNGKLLSEFDSIKPPVWPPVSSPHLSESSLARWAAASGLACAQPSTDRIRCARPHRKPAKLDSDKFGKSAVDQTAGLIESWNVMEDRHHTSSLWYLCMTYWVIIGNPCSWSFIYVQYVKLESLEMLMSLCNCFFLAFLGKNSQYECDTEVNLCYSSPCGINGTCVQKENGYSCLCPPSRTGMSCCAHIT